MSEASNLVQDGMHIAGLVMAKCAAVGVQPVVAIVRVSSSGEVWWLGRRGPQWVVGHIPAGGDGAVAEAGAFLDRATAQAVYEAGSGMFEAPAAAAEDGSPEAV